MPISIACPDCGSTNTVGEDLAGGSVMCKCCSADIDVGEVAPAVAEFEPEVPQVAVVEVEFDAEADDVIPAEAEFESLLDDAVAVEQDARGFEEGIERRQGTVMFRTGFWPYRRETEITRDGSSLLVESRRSLFGISLSTEELPRKQLAAIQLTVIPDDGLPPLWRRFLPIIIPFCIIFFLAITPRDWTINVWIRGIIREIVYLIILLILFVIYLLFFGGGMLLRSLHFANVRNSPKHYQSRYRLKAMSTMKGSWLGDDMMATYIVRLGLRDGISILLYRGDNPELADAAVEQSSRITGLRVKKMR